RGLRLGARRGLRQRPPLRGGRRRRCADACGPGRRDDRAAVVVVTICDVGPRDGLQNEPETLPPAVRADFVDPLAAAGLPRMEAASFVRPDAVPQMAGAEEVVAGIDRRDGTEYSGLALNVKGYERLVATGLDRVNFTLAATESFSRRNANQSLAEARAAAHEILERPEPPVTVPLSAAFGCPLAARLA